MSHPGHGTSQQSLGQHIQNSFMLQQHSQGPIFVFEPSAENFYSQSQQVGGSILNQMHVGQISESQPSQKNF